MPESPHRIFTCWATPTADRAAPWMIWACDEYGYEADPDTVEAQLDALKRDLGGGFEFREITINVSYEQIVTRFVEGEIEGGLADA